MTFLSDAAELDADDVVVRVDAKVRVAERVLHALGGHRCRPTRRRCAVGCRATTSAAKLGPESATTGGPAAPAPTTSLMSASVSRSIPFVATHDDRARRDARRATVAGPRADAATASPRTRACAPSSASSRLDGRAQRRGERRRRQGSDDSRARSLIDVDDVGFERPERDVVPVAREHVGERRAPRARPDAPRSASSRDRPRTRPRLPKRCSSPRRSRPMFARCVQKTNAAMTTLTMNSGERDARA